jgi:hypothetical protein
MADGHVRRSSLTLSPRWDRKVVSIEFKHDLLPIAFFPLDTLPRIEMRKKMDDDDDSVASVTDSIFSIQTASEIWEDVPLGPPDAILGIAQSYRQCEDPRKVNVCVGAYRDEEGKPYVLPCVRTAERMLWEETEIKEYLPIEGDYDFISKAMYFAYGKEMILDHLAAVQTLSGTGACAVGGRFLAQFWPNHPIFVPDPTWGNHIAILYVKSFCIQCFSFHYRSNDVTFSMPQHGAPQVGSR